MLRHFLSVYPVYTTARNTLSTNVAQAGAFQYDIGAYEAARHMSIQGILFCCCPFSTGTLICQASPHPFPIFTEGNKSEIWPQFSTSLACELPLFRNAASYLKSKRNLLSVNNWPKLMQFDPRLPELPALVRPPPEKKTE